MHAPRGSRRSGQVTLLVGILIAVLIAVGLVVLLMRNARPFVPPPVESSDRVTQYLASCLDQAVEGTFREIGMNGGVLSRDAALYPMASYGDAEEKILLGVTRNRASIPLSQGCTERFKPIRYDAPRYPDAGVSLTDTTHDPVLRTLALEEGYFGNLEIPGLCARKNELGDRAPTPDCPTYAGTPPAGDDPSIQSRAEASIQEAVRTCIDTRILGESLGTSVTLDQPVITLEFLPRAILVEMEVHGSTADGALLETISKQYAIPLHAIVGFLIPALVQDTKNASYAIPAVPSFGVEQERITFSPLVGKPSCRTGFDDTYDTKGMLLTVTDEATGYRFRTIIENRGPMLDATDNIGYDSAHAIGTGPDCAGLAMDPDDADVIACAYQGEDLENPAAKEGTLTVTDAAGAKDCQRFEDGDSVLGGTC